LAAALGALLVSACERPPVDTVQRGFRGTAMVQVYNPREVAAQADHNAVPLPQPPAPTDGPKAAAVYQNVQVLGDLSAAEFVRTMLAITSWVAPQQGCGYCHNLANLADDSKYTKVVARRMVQMTRNVNGAWKTHVAQTGVTCYTCHRGAPVPAQIWFKPQEPARSGGMLEQVRWGPVPGSGSAIAALPADPFTPYLLGAQDIRVNGTQALQDGNRHSTRQAESTYSLMLHLSSALGVNCTYCHHTDAFSSWQLSTPQRATAWYGIRMVRELNQDYLQPLTATFPPTRLGPTGDVAKVHCATCHQGAYKPLYGASMAKDYPALAATASP
jgi:photosynthetic reaction center cytochrome c subunit